MIKLAKDFNSAVSLTFFKNKSGHLAALVVQNSLFFALIPVDHKVFDLGVVRDLRSPYFAVGVIAQACR